MAAYKSDGAVCSACKKPGHVEAQCWAAHPKLLPTELLKKRAAAMNVNNRKRIKASEYTRPNDQLQGMALTYHRAALPIMQRRSTRTPIPTRQARESAEQGSARRVHFSTSAAAHAPIVVNLLDQRQADPLTTPPEQAAPVDKPGEPDLYAYKERLPQSFPHGLLDSG